MKNILVHCHIYYPELWKELKSSILNIVSNPLDLYVTMVEEHPAIINDIKNSFPNAKIEIVENRGYDVGPFIHVLNQIDLNNYEYVVKIHTKRDMPQGLLLNNFDVSGKKWRKYALEMLSSPIIFQKCLSAFTKDKKLGILTNYRLITKSIDDNKNSQLAAAEYLKNKDDTINTYAFAAGTMFISRAKLLAPLKQLNLSLADFITPDAKHQQIDLAHIMERLFGAVIYQQGYYLKDRYSSMRYFATPARLLNKLTHFVYRKKITNQGKLQIKICKIPLFNMEVGNK